MSAISVRLSDETSMKLTALAQSTGRSKSFYIRRAIDESIDQMMWEFNILADLEDIRAGRAQTISLEELKAELDV